MGSQLSANVFRDFSGNVSRYLKRKTRRFNVIPRAERQLDRIQQTPIRAPIPEATQKLVEQLMKESPEKFDELKEKNDELYKNLADVYVTSEGNNPKIISGPKVRRGPQRNFQSTQQKHDEVPEGRYNSTRAEHFLAAHARDPKTYNAEVLASVYKVDENAMKNILEFVKMYSVVIPTKVTKRNPIEKMAQDAMPRGLYEEPEMRVVEKKMILAQELMAKFQKKQLQKRPEKLTYDYNIFESLMLIKPLTTELIHTAKRLKETLQKPGMEKESREKKLEEIKEELHMEYANPLERHQESVVSPEEAEKFFREQYEVHTQSDRKYLTDSSSSKESLSRTEEEKSDGVKTLRKEKMS